jgi:hypothetical protein
MVDTDALYRWFDANRQSIIAGHLEQFALIKDGNVLVGYFDDDDEAMQYALGNGLTPGEFLIQDCISKERELDGRFIRRKIHVSFF